PRDCDADDVLVVNFDDYHGPGLDVPSLGIRQVDQDDAATLGLWHGSPQKRSSFSSYHSCGGFLFFAKSSSRSLGSSGSAAISARMRLSAPSSSKPAFCLSRSKTSARSTTSSVPFSLSRTEPPA